MSEHHTVDDVKYDRLIKVMAARSFVKAWFDSLTIRGLKVVNLTGSRELVSD